MKLSYDSEPVVAPILAAVATDVGFLRENNEDNFLLGELWNEKAEDRRSEGPLALPRKGWFCAAVFDGMGGGDRGEWASGAAAAVFRELFRQVQPGTEQLDDLVRQCFLQANRRIVEENRMQAVLGTTGTVACTDGHRVKLYSLGDSRAYLLRGGCLMQLTRDQTLAALKIQMGVYAATSPEAARDRHKLTEYIGCDPTSQGLAPLESQWMELNPGDWLLLCSDGLYDMCPDSEIRELLEGAHSPREGAEALVQAALQKGGEDNITALVLQCPGE